MLLPLAVPTHSRVLWLTVDGWWMQNGHKAPVGKHPFVRISMVPTSSLEDIKTWLTEFCELTYTETANNLRWEKLIPEVVRQPDFYADEYADGESKLSGWDHLIMLVAPEMMQLDDSEQEESGSAYSASDFDADEDDDEDEYDEAVDDDADASEYEESDDDGVDEEADDWDTLEKTALEGGRCCFRGVLHCDVSHLLLAVACRGPKKAWPVGRNGPRR